MGKERKTPLTPHTPAAPSLWGVEKKKRIAISAPFYKIGAEWPSILDVVEGRSLESTPAMQEHGNSPSDAGIPRLKGVKTTRSRKKKIIALTPHTPIAPPV